jgi:hypothetical protein
MKRLIALLALIWLALPAIANAQVATVNTTNENLTVVLAGAKTTVDATYQALWEGSTGGPKVESGVTNGTTAVNMVAGVDGVPPKIVKTVILFNNDTGAITATVNKKVGSTNFPIAKVTLQVSDRLIINPNGEVWVTDTSGQQKTSQSTNITALAIGASTAAAGTTTSDAGGLPAGTASIYPTTAADGTKGVKINAADQTNGRVLYIGNGVSNQILKVYGPTGATINGAAADAAFSSVSGKGVIITCLNSSTNTWLAW